MNKTCDIASSKPNIGGYDASSIAILSGVDAIRKRPALYIGSTGQKGLHHLVFELIENAVDEFLAGECHGISVVLHEDGSCSVTDDGRGIPVELHSEQKRSIPEVLLTELHSGGKFSGSAYRFSTGLHGLGLTCVNALSEWLVLEIWRDGHSYIQEFREGRPKEAMRTLGPTSKRGTRVTFLPDQRIFSDRGLSYQLILARLRELAFLSAGIRLEIKDVNSGQEATLCFASGVVGLLEEINQDRGALHAPISCRGEYHGISVEVALQWTSSYAEEVYSFVNTVRTTEGGSHVIGLKRALRRSIAAEARSSGLLEGDADEITFSDVLEGVGAVLSVRVPEPEFNSQTKSQLVLDAVSHSVENVLVGFFSHFFAQSPSITKVIISRVLQARRARCAARRPALSIRHLRQEMQQSLEIYRQQFGERSKNWHESCTWLKDAGLLQAHAEMCEVSPSARMLDVCCGSGIVGHSFGDRVAHKTGLDITPEMRNMAKLRLNEIREGSVYEIPFDQNSFDLVVTREVIHILSDARKALSEVFRVLSPSGQIIFGQTVPYSAIDAAWSFRIFKKKQPLFCNNFMVEDIQELLSAIGFQDVKMKEYFLWEGIDLWIDTHETSALHRQEIRDLYYNAPEDIKEIHPFEISPDGKIRDQWRWCIFSARKP
jgi:DNA gyrase subunit B